MVEAAQLAREGCPSGTIVGAEEQTAGQGRLGRSWHSPSGTGLYFTQVLRLDLDPQQLPVVTLALGVAVADVLKLFAGVSCDLRWPNDVMASGRKLAGILTRLEEDVVLAGIGLNVNQTAFPPDIGNLATSLRIETGREHDRKKLAQAIAASIDSHVRVLGTSGSDAILSLFTNASSYAIGRRVIVDLPEGAVQGTTAGLTPDGFLRLQKDAGGEAIVSAGAVRPLPDGESPCD
jgi:BirA family transcriptional regulator, biotin operon repressor / biotin---[acetyl-CoA-carboxylase] ligase